MQYIMQSIQSEHTENILSGKKTIEIRTTKPNIELPCEVYIYCTKGGKVLTTKTPKGEERKLNGKVVAKYTLNTIDEYPYIEFDSNGLKNYLIKNDELKRTCITYEQMCKYGKKKKLYGWNIDNLIIFENPEMLMAFRKECKDKHRYCPCCNHGYISYGEDTTKEDIAEGGVDTEWFCCNWVKKPPQSWFYVQELKKQYKE